jgi:hypothetical protein
MNSTLKSDLQFYNIGTQVQNVYLLSNLIKMKAPVYSDSTSFYGEPTRNFSWTIIPVLIPWKKLTGIYHGVIRTSR